MIGEGVAPHRQATEGIRHRSAGVRHRSADTVFDCPRAHCGLPGLAVKEGIDLDGAASLGMEVQGEGYGMTGRYRLAR